MSLEAILFIGTVIGIFLAWRWLTDDGKWR